MTDGTPNVLTRRRLRRPEAVIFILVAAALSYQVLVPPIVGLADNGDYGWLLEPMGLERIEEEYGERYWSYVNREYRIVPRQEVRFITSQLLLAEIALALDHLVTRDDSFDLLYLGTVNLLAYLAGLYLLLLAGGTFRRPTRAVIGVLVLLACTDFAYISTFNSLYSESASLIFLVLLVGTSLVGFRQGWAPAWLVLPFFLFAALFLAAKPQNYPLVLPLVLLALVLFVRLETRASRSMSIASLAGLLLLIGFLYAEIPTKKRSANLWNVVFCSILPDSQSPTEDLIELGLDPELVRYVGVNAWSEDPRPPFEEIGRGFGFVEVGLFYGRNPMRLWRLAAECAAGLFRWRDPLFGNFTREAGRPPRARTESFTFWSSLEDGLFPSSLWFVASFFLLFTAGAAWELWRNDVRSAIGSTAALCLVLALMAVLELAVVVVGEGATDVIKHLFLFQVLFDSCLIAALAWLAGRPWRGSAAGPAVPDQGLRPSERSQSS